MKFVKMHGCGNDYVYLDAVTEPSIESGIRSEGWTTLVKRMSDRHKGIGSDGVIVLCKPSNAARAANAHVRMRMFNADGSESEMCGNGIRCVAKFAHDRLGINAGPMRVETGRGVLSIAYQVAGGKLTTATVDMGEPILEPKRIPVDLAKFQRAAAVRKGDSWSFVSMGNPHAVLWAPTEQAPFGIGSEEFDDFVHHIGPTIEQEEAFPNRTNVHLAMGNSRTHAHVVTWERGAGVTQACGTGACAVLVAGVLNGRLDREAVISVLGGELRVRWDEQTNHVFMSGEAVEVFEGTWPEGEIA